MHGKNPCHKSEVKKLNRIAGQIEGIKKMIEEGRYCPDIIIQLRAVRSAIHSVEANVLESHLTHCVEEAIVSGNIKKARSKVDELKTILKRFNKN